MKIKKSDIVLAITSLLVLFCCMVDIKIINDFVSYGLRVYLRLAMIAGYIALGFIKKKKYSKVFYLISVMMGVIFLGCLLNGYDWNSTIGDITVPFLPCVFLENNKKRIKSIISVWTIALLSLTIIDIVSMVLYPQGLYFDGLYSENWFLGYKSNRFKYYLPLCVFASLISYFRHKKFVISVFVIIAITIYGMFYTESTASGFSLLIYGLLLLLMNMLDVGKIKGRNKFYKFFFSYKTAIIFFVSTAMMIFLISYLPIIQDIVYLLFKKDATLTTRTAIWATCLLQVMKHPFIGIGFVDSSTFIRITNNIYASSAHNMILTILISGGVLSLILYSVIMIMTFRNFNFMSRISISLLLGVFGLWFIGLTSSSYVFSVFGFVFYELSVLSVDYEI